jgi:hypothetical protein
MVLPFLCCVVGRVGAFGDTVMRLFGDTTASMQE